MDKTPPPREKPRRKPYKKPEVKDGKLFERIALGCALNVDEFSGCTPVDLS